MNLASDLEQLVAEFGALCDVQAAGETAPRNVRMVVQGLSSGSINSRNNLLFFIDKNSLPRAADWGYGLILAADAPEGMNPEMRVTVTESTGEAWEVESAKAVHDVDETTLQKRVIAWRLAMRGKQRMVRGR